MKCKKCGKEVNGYWCDDGIHHDGMFYECGCGNKWFIETGQEPDEEEQINTESNVPDNMVDLPTRRCKKCHRLVNGIGYKQGQKPIKQVYHCLHCGNKSFITDNGEEIKELLNWGVKIEQSMPPHNENPYKPNCI